MELKSARQLDRGSGWETVRRLGLMLAPIVALLAAALAGWVAQPVVLALLIAAPGVLLLIDRPGLGLVVLTGLSFTLSFEFGTGSEVSITPPVFLIPLIATVWVVDGLRRHTWTWPQSRSVLPLLLFVAASMLSLLVGTVYWDPAVPRADNLLVVQLAQWVIFALSAVGFLLGGVLGREVEWLAWSVWVFLALCGVVILEYFCLDLRHALTFLNPWRGTTTSMFWTWLGAHAAGQVLFNRRLAGLARIALVAIWAAAFYIVWFRMSEWSSAPVPFTAASGAVVVLRIWRHSRKALIGIALLGLVLVPVVFPLVFEASGGQAEVDYSWGGRLVLYRAVIGLANRNPLLGLGPAAYRHYGFVHWLSLGAGSALYIRPNVSSHNNYIDIYAQAGLVGLSLFLWFLVEVGAMGWRLKDRFPGDFADGYVNGTLGGLAGSLVAMMLVDWFLPYVYNTGFDAFRTSALAWMFLGGLMALEHSLPAEATAASIIPPVSGT